MSKNSDPGHYRLEATLRALNGERFTLHNGVGRVDFALVGRAFTDKIELDTDRCGSMLLLLAANAIKDLRERDTELSLEETELERKKRLGLCCCPDDIFRARGCLCGGK